MLEVGVAVTSIPIVIKSMPPEAIKPLPPVDIHNWPNDAVAWWTFYAAIGAVAVGFVTLGVAVWQIVLAFRALGLARNELQAANKTLKLASDELALTQQSLDATNASNALVSESLEYARRQNDMLFRKADLRLYGETSPQGAPAFQIPAFQRKIVKFIIANNGTKSAREAGVQLLLPPGLSLPLNEAALAAGWHRLQDWNDGQRLWGMYERRLEQTFYPGTVQSAFEVLMSHTGNMDGPLRWRLLYDDGISPSDQPFAALATTETLDRSNIIAGLPPPVGGN